MNRFKIALVSPSGTFAQAQLEHAILRARELGFDITASTTTRLGHPEFLNGLADERLNELSNAEKRNVDGIWCARGGCGALELWPLYHEGVYASGKAPLIGYSDITVYHFMRFYRAKRIGIHGPMVLELAEGDSSHVEALGLLLNKQAERLIYPALKSLNHGLAPAMTGEFLPMNLASLQSMIGCFDAEFLRGKILALEDVNEPHYKVFRALHQLKNARLLAGLKALVVGYFGDDRQAIIDETIVPIASEEGVPVFDWPIFGHARPNWPLLFGANATISTVDGHFFTLTYNEQHDHTPIIHDN